MAVEITNKTRSRVDIAAIRRSLEILLKAYHLEDLTVSVAVIGDQRMRKLNKQWRGKDKTTDILSFESDEEGYLGELLICWQQLKRQAPKWSRSLRAEAVFITVHGFLHLLGYDDADDQEAKIMNDLGAKLIKRYKI